MVSGREGGTGLGLLHRPQSIDQHAGKIEFYQLAGAYRVSVYLPIRK